MDKDIGSLANALKMRKLQQRLRHPKCIPAEEAMHMVELAEGAFSGPEAEGATNVDRVSSYQHRRRLVSKLPAISLRDLLQLSQQEVTVIVGQVCKSRFPREAAGQLGRDDRGRGRDYLQPLHRHLHPVDQPKEGNLRKRRPA